MGHFHLRMDQMSVGYYTYYNMYNLLCWVSMDWVHFIPVGYDGLANNETEEMDATNSIHHEAMS